MGKQKADGNCASLLKSYWPADEEIGVRISVGSTEVGWMKAEDQTILTLHNKVVTHNSRISVTHDNHHTWQLHIRQVKEADRGCYMCQINTSIMKKQVGCVDVHGKSTPTPLSDKYS
uniref:Immunoglobulin-like beta-sandwich domain-containing protein n=1 Tax=Timema monikensis TaxID=170555 RepID=A0A7R9E358_9NEOP|nr:unnamed protein product [Timema monikensis]